MSNLHKQTEINRGQSTVRTPERRGSRPALRELALGAAAVGALIVGGKAIGDRATAVWNPKIVEQTHIQKVPNQYGGYENQVVTTQHAEIEP